VKLNALHHFIEKEEVRYNNTIGDNNELRVKINVMRKEIIFAKDSINAMQEQIA